jgi:hypothetical protein
VLWVPRSRKDKLQYLAGLAIHLAWSPVLTQIVLVYSLLHCDDFKWGKTREVVEDIDGVAGEMKDADDLEKGLVSEGSDTTGTSVPSSPDGSLNGDSLEREK